MSPHRIVRMAGLAAEAVLVVAISLAHTVAAEPAADHAAVFNNNCSVCHQLAGAGLPGQFPRLAGRADRIAATVAGRSYLERVVLFGMAGKITVDGSSIVGVMPSFAALSNSDLAAALDYIVSLDRSGDVHWKGKVFSPTDIARARAGRQLSPAQVHALRAVTLAKRDG